MRHVTLEDCWNLLQMDFLSCENQRAMLGKTSYHAAMRHGVLLANRHAKAEKVSGSRSGLPVASKLVHEPQHNTRCV